MKSLMLVFLLSLSIVGTACRKSATVVAPTAPAVTAPAGAKQETAKSKPEIVTFRVEPAAVEPGQSAVLSWNVLAAAAVVIQPDVGNVGAKGRLPIAPTKPTTYRLVATGEGGSVSASATLRLMARMPPPRGLETPENTSDASAGLEDIYFDPGRLDVNEDALEGLLRNAHVLRGLLREAPEVSVIIEAHVDAHGSAEHILAVGDRHAWLVRNSLVQFGGLPEDLFTLVSWGLERSQCSETRQSCVERTRVHLAVVRSRGQR